MKKEGVVIAGFAGIGKTTLAKKYKNVADVESSPYKWDYSGMDCSNLEKLKGTKNRKPNANFPENYIEAIKNAQKKFDIVLVWIHPEEILPEYEKHNIDYILAFPSKEAIQGYRERFVSRGNNSEYIERVIGNYDLRYKQYTSSKHKKIELQEGETLEGALLRLGYKLEKK